MDFTDYDSAPQSEDQCVPNSEQHSNTNEINDNESFYTTNTEDYYYLVELLGSSEKVVTDFLIEQYNEHLNAYVYCLQNVSTMEIIEQRRRSCEIISNVINGTYECKITYIMKMIDEMFQYDDDGL